MITISTSFTRAEQGGPHSDDPKVCTADGTMSWMLPSIAPDPQLAPLTVLIRTPLTAGARKRHNSKYAQVLSRVVADSRSPRGSSGRVMKRRPNRPRLQRTCHLRCLRSLLARVGTAPQSHPTPRATAPSVGCCRARLTCHRAAAPRALPARAVHQVLAAAAVRVTMQPGTSGRAWHGAK